MPRHWLQGRLPTNQQMRETLGITKAGSTGFFGNWLGSMLADPALWYLNRRCVAGAVAIGLFVAWMPIPMQMVFAAILAALVRVHVPISVMLVWVSNPITVAPLLYAAWYVGSIVLGAETSPPALSHGLDVLMSEAVKNWTTVLFGTILMGCLSAIGGFVLAMTAWRVLTIRRWKARSTRTLLPAKITKQPYAGTYIN